MEHLIEVKDDAETVYVSCDEWDGDGSTWLRISRSCGSMNAVLTRENAAQLRDALNNILGEVTA